MIYLATPYTHPDPAVMESRFDAACCVAGQMMAAGNIVYSPIAHTHPIAVRCELPRDWGFWQRYDREMLARSTRLVVVQMEGWLTSQGIAGEIRIASEFGIPVEYMEYSDKCPAIAQGGARMGATGAGQGKEQG